MLILLPPSETKHVGGRGAPLDLAALAFPSLTGVREQLLKALPELHDDPAVAATALGVSAGLYDEVAAHNTTVLTGPTMPALDRYTGVLFAALTEGGFSKALRAKAQSRLLITSALFGQLAAGDQVPAYRLSAGSRLPGLPTVQALWKPALTPVLAALDGPVVDLRSGSYAAFAPAPGTLQVRVVTVLPDGRRLSVSHDNKATKGRLARLLATSRAEPADLDAVIRVIRRAGWTVERTADTAIDVPLLR